MPQLDTFSFVSQITWLAILFIFTYSVSLKFYLPAIIVIRLLRFYHTSDYIECLDLFRAHTDVLVQKRFVIRKRANKRKLKFIKSLSKNITTCPSTPEFPIIPTVIAWSVLGLFFPTDVNDDNVLVGAFLMFLFLVFKFIPQLLVIDKDAYVKFIRTAFAPSVIEASKMSHIRAKFYEKNFLVLWTIFQPLSPTLANQLTGLPDIENDDEFFSIDVGRRRGNI